MKRNRSQTFKSWPFPIACWIFGSVPRKMARFICIIYLHRVSTQCERRGPNSPADWLAKMWDHLCTRAKRSVSHVFTTVGSADESPSPNVLRGSRALSMFVVFRNTAKKEHICYYISPIRLCFNIISIAFPNLKWNAQPWNIERGAFCFPRINTIHSLWYYTR